jgi:hypothetical protein
MKLRSLAVAAVIPLALGLAGCGGGGGKSDTGVASAGKGSASASASPSSSADAQDAQLKFAQCMRENGVNVKDPAPGQPVHVTVSGGSDSGKLQSATKKCQHFLQDGGVAAGGNDQQQEDAMVKFAQCMRQNGIDMPDPKAGGGLKLTAPKGSQKKVQAAQKKCQHYLPGAGAPVTGGASQ